jgi:hypothetical protein
MDVEIMVHVTSIPRAAPANLECSTLSDPNSTPFRKVLRNDIRHP